MKDVAGSGKAPNGLVCGDLAKRHSKMFSVMLVLTLIALVAFAAFLVSDIMSFESNASYGKPFSVFSFMDSKENGIAIEDQQDDAIDLANQGNGQEPSRVLESAAASNLSREDKGTHIGTLPSSLNGSEAAKGSLAGDDTGKRPGSTAGANSSLKNTSTLTGQTAGTVVTIIKPSSSGSHRSDKNKKHSSSKNDIQVNRNASSPSSITVENQSQINQSQSRINLSSNLSMNLSASASEMNAAETPSYNSRPEDTDKSLGNSPANSSTNFSTNSSANPDALSQLDTNSTVSSDPNVLDANLTTAANFPAKLDVSEMSSVDSESSNMVDDATMGLEENVKAQVEPSVRADLPIQELSREDSVPPGDDEDLGYLEYDSSYEGIPDELASINSDIDTNNVEVFTDPVVTEDKALPTDDVLSGPQYPEHSIAAGGEGPVNSQKEPAQFVGSQEDESVEGNLGFTESTSKVVPADKSSYEWQGAENKRISNRDKRDKPAKYLKRPTPPARPARIKPVKPARENSRDRR
jgi:hypothetical protein